MAKKTKMIQNHLIKNAIAPYFAAIEIHNKPNISYHYETVTLLMMNAWELVLKAYIRKNDKEHSISQKDGYTISITDALSYVNEHISAKKPKAILAVKANIGEIIKLRNKVAHFYNEELTPCVFTLVSMCTLNFIDFVRTYFPKAKVQEDGLFIMPMGFDPKERSTSA